MIVCARPRKHSEETGCNDKVCPATSGRHMQGIAIAMDVASIEEGARSSIAHTVGCLTRGAVSTLV